MLKRLKYFKDSKILLVFIFLFAFALRVLFIISYDNHKLLSDELYNTDAYGYLEIASNFLQGKGLIAEDNVFARREPVYPIFLAISFILFSINFVAIRFVQAFLGALTCVVVYFIAKELFNSLTGVIAALISSVYYSLIQLSGYINSETVFTFLLSLSILILLMYKRFVLPGLLFLSGIVLGITTLCRGITLFFMPMVIFWLFILPKNTLRIKLKEALLIGLSFILIFGPWVLRNYSLYGEFVPLTTTGGHTLYFGNNPTTPGSMDGYWESGRDSNYPRGTSNIFSLETDRFLRREALNYMRTHKLRCLILSGKKIINMWRPYHIHSRLISKLVMVFSYVPIMILGILGIVLSLKDWRAHFLIYSLILIFVLIYALSISCIRYRYPVMPYFCIYCSYAIVYLTNRFLLGRKTHQEQFPDFFSGN